MKIDKSELIKKISMLEKVIPTKPAVPCMEGILVKDGRMCANDYQIAISIAVPEAAEECFIIPKKAIAMAKNLPEGLVELTPQGNGTLLIKAGTIRTKMNTFSPDDFPENFHIPDAMETTLDFVELCDMLENTVYATSTNEVRPVFTGVLLEGDGENLNVVACDGYRCAWAHTKYAEEFKMVIPKPTVKMLLTIKGGDKVCIQTKGEKAVFTIGDCEIYSRLLAGAFLEYKRIYPKWEHSIGVDRVQLMDAMRRIAICSDDAQKGKVEMDGSGIKLQLLCRGSSAEYIEEIEVKDEFAQDMKIMFNSAFFLDALKSYDCSVIDCFFGGKSTDALVIDDGQLKSLILPVRMATEK